MSAPSGSNGGAATREDSRREGPQFLKAQRLLAELESENLSFLMEAHNGLSAKIAEEAGFSGIWASGLSISAALGVRAQQRTVMDAGTR